MPRREPPTIAYLVLVHRYPEQFKRLFKAIHDPANHYLVHVDKNADPGLEDELRRFLASYPNAAVLEGAARPVGRLQSGRRRVAGHGQAAGDGRPVGLLHQS